MSASFALDIAGIRIALASEPDLPIAAAGAATKFVAAAEHPEVRVRVRWGDPVEPDTGQLIFDSGKGLWRLYQGGLGRRFVFTSSLLGPAPYQTASFSPDFTEGEVVLRHASFAGRLPVYPLQYPLDELLVVHLLARGRGVAIHGSGVVDADGRATLFAGQSGAGKTTMARLWLGQPGVQILSDERIVLRQEGDTIWMYGTPWHGDGRIANQGRAPLARICLLRHAPMNRMRALSPSEAVARLFSCCFPPFHDARALDGVLAALEQIAARCACVELGFVPDATAPAFVRAS
ncbi:MAG TPA: hypothetical protein VHG72_01845 [Polyangia bacterium]|nr:hypothetical protein [Polyangia bacterium]